MSTLVFRAVPFVGAVLVSILVVGVMRVSASTAVGTIVGKIEAVNYLSNGAMAITGWACAYGRVDAAAVAAHADSASGALVSAAWAVMPGSTALITSCGLDANSSLARNYHQYKLYVPSGTAEANKGKTLYVTASYTGTSSITNGTLDHSGEYTIKGSGASSGAVIDTQTPTLTLSSNQTSVATGDSVTLTWSSNHATACIASEGWDGAKGTSGTETIFALSQNETFTLTCTGTGGTVIKSVAVSVTGGAPGGKPTPTVTIDAAPKVVALRGETIVSWSATDATTCTASGGWSGVRDVIGAEIVSNLSASSTTFTITCAGDGGTKSASVIVTAEDTSVPPVVTMSANPTSVRAGSSTVLTWSSTRAHTCTASGGWSGTKNTSGTEVIVQVRAYTTFTLTCTGDGGEKTASVSVSVSEQSTSTPTITLSASPASVRSGSSTVVTWSTTNATSCVAEGDWTGARGMSGHETITNITSVNTFTLTCTGSGGTESKTVTVAPEDGALKLTLVAQPTSVAYGKNTVLLWVSSGANSCTASGGWSGTMGAKGTTTIAGITSARTFTLTCSGAGSSVTKSVNVTVAGQGASSATLAFSASQTTVARGGGTTLTWSSSNVTSCMAASGWSGYKPVRGTETITNITTSLTFKLACIGSSGMVTKDVTVTVSGQTAGGPTLTLTANPTTVSSGGNSKLTWASTGAASCSASGDWTGTRGTNGTETLANITSSKNYSLSCTGTSGAVTKSVQVSTH